MNEISHQTSSYESMYCYRNYSQISFFIQKHCVFMRQSVYSSGHALMITKYLILILLLRKGHLYLYQFMPYTMTRDIIMIQSYSIQTDLAARKLRSDPNTHFYHSVIKFCFSIDTFCYRFYIV